MYWELTVGRLESQVLEMSTHQGRQGTAKSCCRDGLLSMLPLVLSPLDTCHRLLALLPLTLMLLGTHSTTALQTTPCPRPPVPEGTSDRLDQGGVLVS